MELEADERETNAPEFIAADSDDDDEDQDDYDIEEVSQVEK